MKVILTVNFSPWSAYSGGGQQSTHNLATALSRRGHDVTVIYTRAPWEQVKAPAEAPYRIAWAALPAFRSHRRALLRPLTAVTVARVLEQLLQPGTVVHANGEEAALFGRLRRRHAFPFVLTPRYPRYPVARLAAPSSLVRRLSTSPKFLLLARAIHEADVCCPTSRSAAHMIRQAYALDESRLRVVPNGVPEAFMQVRRSDDAARGDIIFFGRLAHSKGADLLLDALARVAEPLTCLIVGRGEAEAALARQIRTLGLGGRVSMRSWASPAELALLLARASMAVLPSREESFGNTMAEAMAAGVPVVSTDVGSIPELITHETTGLLVPSDDAAALAAAIRRLHQDTALAERIGCAASRHIKDHFTWDAVAIRFEGIYTGLLST